jgi:RND family efflux transporter MFP subunit
MTKTDAAPKNQRRTPRKWVGTLLLCVVVIAAGLGVSAYIKKTAPKAQKREPVNNIPRVETQDLVVGDHQVSIDAMGSVVPAREVTLKARVSGEIVSLHPDFITGGFVGQGEPILKIDPQDYRLALARKKSQLVNSQYELKLEMGYQEVARREWSLINKGKPATPEDAELALRKPHLAKARSDLAAAEAELEQAKLNLSRTEIEAPFNAIIRAKHVEIGSQISTQDALAELVGTDEYWIRASLPVDRLRWFRIPASRNETGALVTVHYRGYRRTGRVIRLLGDLETQGRMARILVSVKDPLNISDSAPDQPPMLIGEYVRIEIQGDRLDSVYRIPRSALRDNNTIWLAGADDTLLVRSVEPVWRDDRLVLVEDSIKPGERLIVSDLATPVAGMPIEASPVSPRAAKPAAESDRNQDGK